jgi:uncharacterized surface anchored protein
LPPNGYVADIRGGGASIDNSEIDISSQVGEIEVLVKTDGRRIEGVVRDTFQNAVALARVALVPASMSRRQNVQLYKTVVTQNTGSFTITGVAPGEYKLFAWESAPNTAWMDAEFLAPYETRGQTVNIGATATTTVDLRLIPSPNPTK